MREVLIVLALSVLSGLTCTMDATDLVATGPIMTWSMVMNRPLDVDFHQASLAEVLNTLSRSTGQIIAVCEDIQALKGHDLVTFRASGMGALTILAYILKTDTLYTQQMRGYLLVSFKPIPGSVYLAMYDVSDLIIPIQSKAHAATASYIYGDRITDAIVTVDCQSLRSLDARHLIALIKSRVAPSRWSEEGNLLAISGQRLLFVCQTQEIQDQVGAMLDDLRMQCVPLQQTAPDPAVFHLADAAAAPAGRDAGHQHEH